MKRVDTRVRELERKAAAAEGGKRPRFALVATVGLSPEEAARVVARKRAEVGPDAFILVIDI